MLHKESVTASALELIYSLQEQSYLNEFFLVGGTGLSLQIGHRKSDDIDLFTIKDFDQMTLLERLESDFEFTMDFIGTNTLKGSIRDIKLDILSHKYPLINPVLKIEGISVASVQDISAMKLNAISNDGTRVKDFIDVYFLLQDYSIGQLLNSFQAKYKLRSALHAFKSLNYFEEVEIDDWPEIIRESGLTWERIKKEINTACKQYFFADGED